MLDVAAVRIANHETPEECANYYDGCHCLEYRVIEVNCINSAGFYAADMRPVIEAIEKCYLP